MIESERTVPPKDENDTHFRSQVLRELDQIRGSVGKLTDELTTARLSMAQISPEAWIARMKTAFVTREEFRPISRLVWGFTSICLSAIVVALVGLVVKAGGALK